MTGVPAGTGGERWARQLLADLRDDGSAPAAWIRFLRSSFERAREVRTARPDLARQSRRLGLAGLTAWIAVRGAMRVGILPPVRRRAGGLTWWAMTWCMLDWHLGMVEGPAGERRERLSAADAVTLARFWLVPLLSACAGRRRQFLAVLAIGSASDLSDGLLARRSGPTRLGRDLDTTADIAFFTTGVAAAARSGWIDRRAPAVLATRYVVGVAFVALHYFTRAERPAPSVFPETRWTAPFLAAGLAAGAGGRRRAGTALVAGSAVAALLLSLRDRAR